MGYKFRKKRLETDSAAGGLSIKKPLSGPGESAKNGRCAWRFAEFSLLLRRIIACDRCVFKQPPKRPEFLHFDR